MCETSGLILVAEMFVMSRTVVSEPDGWAITAALASRSVATAGQSPAVSVLTWFPEVGVAAVGGQELGVGGGFGDAAFVEDDDLVGGDDGAEPVGDERLAMALNGSVGQAIRVQLEPRLGPTGWQAALDDARGELRVGVVDGGVRLVGHTWLVTAANR